jgi:hypothetical protein
MKKKTLLLAPRNIPARSTLTFDAGPAQEFTSVKLEALGDVDGITVELLQIGGLNAAIKLPMSLKALDGKKTAFVCSEKESIVMVLSNTSDEMRCSGLRILGTCQ